MSSACDEGCGRGQTWVGYHKGFGTRATSSGLYLRLEAPNCSELLSPCHHLYSPWLMSPLASLGLHYPCVYCGNVRTSPCGELLLRLMGRGLTVTWLTFTLTLTDRFTWYGHEALVHYGRGLWGPWIQVVKRGRWLIYEPGLQKFLEMSKMVLMIMIVMIREEEKMKNSVAFNLKLLAEQHCCTDDFWSKVSTPYPCLEWGYCVQYGKNWIHWININNIFHMILLLLILHCPNSYLKFAFSCLLLS